MTQEGRWAGTSQAQRGRRATPLVSGRGGPGAVLCSSFTPDDTEGLPWWGRVGVAASSLMKPFQLPPSQSQFRHPLSQMGKLSLREGEDPQLAMAGLASKYPLPTRDPGNFQRPWGDSMGRGPRARSSATYTG